MKMIIAISTDSDEVYAHFGRARQFTFITIKGNELIKKEVLSNPGHTIGSIPKFINEHGAECMISGGMGQRAINFFKQYGIDVILGVTGKINDVIKQILDGTLEGGKSLCSPGASHDCGVIKIDTELDDGDRHHQP